MKSSFPNNSVYLICLFMFILFFFYCTSPTDENQNPYRVISEDAVTTPDSSTVWTLLEDSVLVEWDTKDMGSSVRMVLFKRSDSVMVIVQSTPNDGEYRGFSVPLSLIPDNAYRVRISSIEDPRRYDYSDYFSVVIGSDPVGRVVLTSKPPLAENILFDYESANYDSLEPTPPHWKLTNQFQNGYLRFYFDNQFAFRFHAYGNPVNKGDPDSECYINIWINSTLFWEYKFIDNVWMDYTIPLKQFSTGENRVAIYKKGPSLFWIDLVEIGDFEVTTGEIQVFEPNESTIWQQGQSDVVVRWDPAYRDGDVQILLLRGNGFDSSIIATTPNDGYYAEFNVPVDQTIAGNYQVQVTRKNGKLNSDDDGYWDNSDYFQIDQ